MTDRSRSETATGSVAVIRMPRGSDLAPRRAELQERHLPADAIVEPVRVEPGADVAAAVGPVAAGARSRVARVGLARRGHVAAGEAVRGERVGSPLAELEV